MRNPLLSISSLFQHKLTILYSKYPINQPQNKNQKNPTNFLFIPPKTYDSILQSLSPLPYMISTYYTLFKVQIHKQNNYSFFPSFNFKQFKSILFQPFFLFPYHLFFPLHLTLFSLFIQSHQQNNTKNSNCNFDKE